MGRLSFLLLIGREKFKKYEKDSRGQVGACIMFLKSIRKREGGSLNESMP
jgi:hypothetical protein